MNPLLVKGILSLPLLFEKTVSISGKKNQKRCEEIAKEISQEANYRMNQTCLRFSFCLPRQSNHPDCLYQKKVWLKGTQPKYLSKLTFTMFQSVCCLFHAKSFRLSDHEKSSVLLSIFCYVSLNQALFGCSSLNLNISRLK